MYFIIGLLMVYGIVGLFQWFMFGYWFVFFMFLVFIERIVWLLVGFYKISVVFQVLDSEIVVIRVKILSERIWKYNVGQYVFLQVLVLSFFQWYFFIVFICIGNEMQFYIKIDGNWICRFCDLVGKDGIVQIQIGINGLFGVLVQCFYDFSYIIVVGVGIGVIFFSGIFMDL